MRGSEAVSEAKKDSWNHYGVNHGSKQIFEKPGRAAGNYV